MSLCSHVAWPRGWMPCSRVATCPLLPRAVVAWGCSSPLPFPYMLGCLLLLLFVVMLSVPQSLSCSMIYSSAAF